MTLPTQAPHSPRLWNANYCKVWLANFLLYFSFMLLTPLFPIYLSDTFGASKHTIGLVLSGYTLTALVVRPFSGYLVDSFPRRRVLLVSFFLFSILFAGYPLAGALWLFAVVRTLHGAPFGAATVANSTVAIDVLPAQHRAEGIGYYGLSNNIATAISPSVALALYAATESYTLLFGLALVFSGLALWCNSRVKIQPRQPVLRSQGRLSLDRFLLLRAWRLGLCMASFAFAYGVISTYIAIYGRQELGITQGTGLWFLLLSAGLILSRLTGGRSLRRGRVVQNASMGVLVSVCGYVLFAAVHSPWAYYGAALIIGLGNGHMFPAFQTLFLRIAGHNQRGTANSTLYVSWDTGFGLGVMLGGMLADYWGYGAAFWMMAGVNLLGVAFYFACAKRHALRSTTSVD